MCIFALVDLTTAGLPQGLLFVLHLFLPVVYLLLRLWKGFCLGKSWDCVRIFCHVAVE